MELSPKDLLNEHFPAEAAMKELVAPSPEVRMGFARAAMEQPRGRMQPARSKRDEQLQQAQRMESVGRLAGGVVHDFNNLLTVILSYCELMRPNVDLDHPIQDGLEQIERAAVRAAALTQQLLAFSRQKPSLARPVDINESVAETQCLLRRLIGENVELCILLAADLKSVHADPGQIEQVIMNLALNARDAMPAGGTLSIETQNRLIDASSSAEPKLCAGRYVVLIVKDSGCGMDKPTQQRMFEPFFTTKEQGKGTGLGLATVHNIVQQCGGSIVVDSDLTRGTTFRLYFPAVDDTAPELEPPVAQSTPSRGSETVLLVEDDDRVRTLIRDVLRRQGYRVLDSQVPAEAIKMSKQHQADIHLLLTDIVMPQMSGRKLAEALVSQRHNLHVIYMSGYTDDLLGEDPKAAFLPKPLTPLTLLRKVREVFDSGAGTDAHC